MFTVQQFKFTILNEKSTSVFELTYIQLYTVNMLLKGCTCIYNKDRGGRSKTR